MNSENISESPDIQILFPRCVISECCRIQDELYMLYPEEQAIVRRSVAKRRREFSAGRVCARRALARLGLTECVLTRNPDGTTAWPPKVTGTISHNDTWCGSAVAWQSDIAGIGLDIETVERITTQIAKRVLTRSELAWLSGKPEDETQKWSALIFSAKEAIYKCLFPHVDAKIRYYDAEIIPADDGISFAVKLSKNIAFRISSFPSLSGRYLVHEGDVFTGVILRE